MFYSVSRTYLIVHNEPLTAADITYSNRAYSITKYSLVQQHHNNTRSEFNRAVYILKRIKIAYSIAYGEMMDWQYDIMKLNKKANTGCVVQLKVVLKTFRLFINMKKRWNVQLINLTPFLMK